MYWQRNETRERGPSHLQRNISTLNRCHKRESRPFGLKRDDNPPSSRWDTSLRVFLNSLHSSSLKTSGYDTFPVHVPVVGQGRRTVNRRWEPKFPLSVMTVLPWKCQGSTSKPHDAWVLLISAPADGRSPRTQLHRQGREIKKIGNIFTVSQSTRI